MKYYSEKLNKNFDTVEELEKAEIKLNDTSKLVDEINAKIDVKLEEYKEAERKVSELLLEISKLLEELIDADPSEFLRVFEIVSKLREISNDVLDKHLNEKEEVPTPEAPDKKESDVDEDEDKVDLEIFLGNILHNLSE